MAYGLKQEHVLLSTRADLVLCRAVKSTEFKLLCFLFESSAMTLLSLCKTLNHCSVLRKAVGRMCYVTHEKEPRALIEKRSSKIEIDSSWLWLLCARQHLVMLVNPYIKMLNNWVSEFITAITINLSKSLYILSTWSTLFGRYKRYNIRL